MRILFAVVDGGGNIPPQLGVARALHRRGAEIHVIGHEGVRKWAEGEGFSFEAFAAGQHFDPTVPRPLLVLMKDYARMAMDRRLGRAILEAARRLDVDLIVVDMIMAGGISEILASDIPAVVFVHCFYRGVQDLAASPVGMALRLRGIAPLGAEQSTALQIVSARADLDPVRGAPPVRHIGVVWQGVPKAAVATPVPRVLVSLSTCAFAGQRSMLQNILDAVAPLTVEVTVTLGPTIDPSTLRVPPNASVHEWLDHDEVLATASLVVGHGGHSTTMRALSFGVPLVVMPSNPMIDQKGVGKALEKAGAGILLPKHAGAKRIQSAVSTVLHEPNYRQAAARLGEQIRERDGAEAAADLIKEYAGSRVH